VCVIKCIYIPLNPCLLASLSASGEAGGQENENLSMLSYSRTRVSRIWIKYKTWIPAHGSKCQYVFYKCLCMSFLSRIRYGINSSRNPELYSCSWIPHQVRNDTSFIILTSFDIDLSIRDLTSRSIPSSIFFSIF
jgi:hypothetical protein